MRPSSSPSDAARGGQAPGLLDGLLARGPVRELVGDAALLRAMLDVEAALARANAAAGVVTADDAERVVAACDAGDVDVARLGAAATSSGNPVVPLVQALREQVGEPAARAVHAGATSQDVLDSAWMLLARRALPVIAGDLDGAAACAATLAERHRDSPMPARTLLQQALPTTFGLKAASWMVALGTAGDRLRTTTGEALAAQLGGAAGTLASLEGHGEEVSAHFARELGLPEPLLPWHTDRTRFAALAGACGSAAAVVAKVARDIVLLAQTEVAEVREVGGAGRGGSSTLPHKRNPVAAVAAAACATRAPGLVATLLAAAGGHEHERAAGAWHAEWAPLRDLFTATASAASWLRDALEHLEVDAAAMRSNLQQGGDVLLAERVVTALTPALGRLGAGEAVRAAVAEASATGRTLHGVLSQDPAIGHRLDADALARLLDPATYLGDAGRLVDRALSAHRERTLALGHLTPLAARERPEAPSDR